MPCRVDHNYEECLQNDLTNSQKQVKQLMQLCDLLTQLLCSVMSTFDRFGEVTTSDLSKEVLDWWDEHKEVDRKRIIAERAILDEELKRLDRLRENTLEDLKKISARMDVVAVDMKKLGE